MPRYKFRSMDKRGQACEGTASAPNLAALTELLRQQNQFMISASVIVDKPAAAPAAAPRPQRTVRVGRSRRVTEADIAICNSQLSLMIRSAVPILEALQTVANQQSNPALRKVLADVAEAVRGGSTLTAAFGRHPALFDNVYLSLLEAGEVSGNLPKMLERIGHYLDFKVGVRSRVRSAMIYPAVVMGSAVLIVGALVVFVLPTFAEVFEQFDAALPPATQFLLWVSATLRTRWPACLAAAAAFAVAARLWFKAERNRLLLHTLALRLPVIGPVTRAIVITRMTRVLSDLLGSGVTILKALDLTEASAGNLVFARIIRRMRTQVEAGEPLWTSLAASDDVPEMVPHLVAGAEKSGRLPEALSFIADYYQREIDTALRDLFAALEPAFVLFLGLTIGGIAVTMLMPILQLGGIVQ